MDPKLLEHLNEAAKEAEREKAEWNHKTKKFANGCTYVGEFLSIEEKTTRRVQKNENTCKIKIPHGVGELFRAGGTIIYEGEWSHGKMSGKGKLYWENDDSWEGVFRDNRMHGLGVKKFHVTTTDKKGRRQKVMERECIYRHNRRVCWTDELLHSWVNVKIGQIWRAGVVRASDPKISGRFLIQFDDMEPIWMHLDHQEFSIQRVGKQLVVP
mmetsp:Transcript_7850/g.9346  ORF Transcript_7850/g.9346 Transcript_7850/m.9346 type:complete len:212 (+) Transcript_7850:2-637(+)